MTADNRNESAPLRLARYLKEFVGLRSTTVRDVDKYETVLWFDEMPQVADCRSGAWTDDYDLEEPWLEVRKQQFETPPEPPDMIVKWVDAEALRRATRDITPLRQSILEEDAELELEDGETPPLVERPLEDYPEVDEAYGAFRPRWEAWERPNTAVVRRFSISMLSSLGFTRSCKSRARSSRSSSGDGILVAGRVDLRPGRRCHSRRRPG